MGILAPKISGQTPVAAILTATVPFLGVGCFGVSVHRRTPAGVCVDGAADAISSAGEHGEIGGSHRVFLAMESG